MQRAILLAAGIAGALAIYFVMSLYVFPQSFLAAPKPAAPEAVLDGVWISSRQIILGEAVTVSVTGRNAQGMADFQIVSVGFPNLTASSEVEILRHDFRQMPLRVDRGDPVGSGYTGASTVSAQYPSIEAFSRPWEGGATYSIDLQAKPQAEGKFVVFVKSVAFPHTWEGAHYPREGLVDYQQEFVESYSVQVTKS